MRTQAVYVTDVPIWYGVPAVKKLVVEAFEYLSLMGADIATDSRCVKRCLCNVGDSHKKTWKLVGQYSEFLGTIL